MKKELYTLTDVHRSQLDGWSKKWIANGMSTKPMDDFDREQMRKAIKGMYEAANLTPPPENRIVFVPSPFVLRFAAGFASAIWYLRKNKTFKVAATYDATRAATNAATYDATRAATDAATDYATRAAKKSWFRFNASTMVSLSASLDIGKFGLQCAGSAFRMLQGGNFWSGWPSFISFFRHVAKLDIDYSKWDHWEKATIHGSYRVIHENFAMISDRPIKLEVDDQNRPHCFDGPYIEWSDGSALYAIHGTRVPAWICDTSRDQFTKEMILSETNVDNRRCIIQKIGIDRAIEVLGAETIDSHVSQVGGKYELLSIDYDGRGNKIAQYVWDSELTAWMQVRLS